MKPGKHRYFQPRELVRSQQDEWPQPTDDTDSLRATDRARAARKPGLSTH